MSTSPASAPPPSPAQHRTQFIRGVRDSMAKALAQGLGEPGTIPEPTPPPPIQHAQSVAASRSITGRLKQLIEKPAPESGQRRPARGVLSVLPSSPRRGSAAGVYPLPAGGAIDTATVVTPRQLAQTRGEPLMTPPLMKSGPRAGVTPRQWQQDARKVLVVSRTRTGQSDPSHVGWKSEFPQTREKPLPGTCRVAQHAGTRVSAVSLATPPRQVAPASIVSAQQSPVQSISGVTVVKLSPQNSSPVKTIHLPALHQPTPPFKLSQETLKSMVNNINTSVAAAGGGLKSPATATSLKPSPNNQKPIVRLSEKPSVVDKSGHDLLHASDETSEERKRMIALAQLKILQRKPMVVHPEQVREVELITSEMSGSKNGHVDRVDVSVTDGDVNMLTPDVVDANRCASGLLVRKTYLKPPNAEAQGSPASELSPQPSVSDVGAPVQKRRGRPKRHPPVIEPERNVGETELLNTSKIRLLTDCTETGSPAVSTASGRDTPVPTDHITSEVAATVNGSSQTSQVTATSISTIETTRKRRHELSVERGSTGSSGGSSGVSGRSSVAGIDPPATKKPKARRYSRLLANLAGDEGVINIMTELSLRGGDKRRARTSKDRMQYKLTRDRRKKGNDMAKYVSNVKRNTVSSRAALKGKVNIATPAAKLKAKALLVKKKPCNVKQDKRHSPIKVKLKAKLEKPHRPLKVVVKSEKKLTKRAGSKPTVQNSPTRNTKGKLSGALSPSNSVAAKKTIKSATVKSKLATASPSAIANTSKATTLQTKPKKVSASEKPDGSTGKKSALTPSAVVPTTMSGSSQEKDKTQLKPSLDKNLNNNDKKEKTKETKSVERKKDTSTEDRRVLSVPPPAKSDKSISPPSKSSRSVTPPPAEPGPEPASPGFLTYSSLQRRLEMATVKQARRRVVPEDRERSSSRSNLGTVRHREICVKKFARFHQVVLCPVTTRLRAGLNVQVMREVREYLAACARDPACRAVLLTSSAGPFCQGVDYSCLLGLSPEKRRRAAEELANELKEFVRAVAGFSKPLLAGVTGACVGLGVGLLPLCDLVYISEKATLQTFYSRLGTVPEGGATHSLTVLLGHMKAGSLLMTGRVVTGSEAHQLNLATGVLWSATAYEDLISQARDVLDNAAQVQSLESTKALIRHSLRAKIEMALHSECRLLVHQWSAPEFQQRVRSLYDSGLLQVQKAGFDTQ